MVIIPHTNIIVLKGLKKFGTRQDIKNKTIEYHTSIRVAQNGQNVSDLPGPVDFPF